MSNIKLWIASIVVGLSISGCNSEDAFSTNDNGNSGNSSHQIEKVELYAKSGEEVKDSFPKGLPIQMYTDVFFDDGLVVTSPNDGEYTSKAQWSIPEGEGNDIASINETGLITTTGVGTVTVQLSELDGEKRTTTEELTITDASLNSVSINSDAPNDRAPLGVPIQLTAHLTFSDGTYIDSPNDGTYSHLGRWSVVDGRRIAQVSETGMVTSTGTGSVIVRLRNLDKPTEYIDKTLTITDAVMDGAQITHSADSDSIPEGIPVQFTATVHFTDGTTIDSPNDGSYSSLGAWSVQQGGAYAEISPTGLLTSTGTGPVTVRLSEKGSERYLEKTIEIISAELTDLRIISDKFHATAPAGIPIQMSALLKFSNGTFLKSPNDGTYSSLASWSVEPSAIASITQQGVVNTTAEGEVIVTLTEVGGDGRTAQLPLTITAAVLNSVDIESDQPGDSAPAGVPIQLTAVATFSDGEIIRSTNDGTYSGLASWSIIEGDSIATISQQGLVSTTSSGRVVAQLLENGGQARQTIKELTVTDAIVTTAELQSDALGDTAPVGVPIKMSAELTFSDDSTITTDNDGTYGAYGSWSIHEGSDIASISPTGEVTTTGEGAVTVRLTETDGDGRYIEKALSISAAELESIEILSSPSESAIPTGTPVQFTGKLTFTDGSEIETPNDGSMSGEGLWTLTHGADIASISGTGLLQTTGRGNVTVRLESNEGIYQEKNLRITHSELNSVEITTPGDEVSFEVGESIQLSALLSFDNGQTLVSPNDGAWAGLGAWSITSGDSIASISSTGLVTTTGDGEVTVQLASSIGDENTVEKTLTIESAIDYTGVCGEPNAPNMPTQDDCVGLIKLDSGQLYTAPAPVKWLQSKGFVQDRDLEGNTGNSYHDSDTSNGVEIAYFSNDGDGAYIFEDEETYPDYPDVPDVNGNGQPDDVGYLGQYDRYCSYLNDIAFSERTNWRRITLDDFHLLDTFYSSGDYYFPHLGTGVRKMMTSVAAMDMTYPSSPDRSMIFVNFGGFEEVKHGLLLGNGVCTSEE